MAEEKPGQEPIEPAGITPQEIEEWRQERNLSADALAEVESHLKRLERVTLKAFYHKKPKSQPKEPAPKDKPQPKHPVIQKRRFLGRLSRSKPQPQ